jgi:hypothetical protein
VSVLIRYLIKPYPIDRHPIFKLPQSKIDADGIGRDGTEAFEDVGHSDEARAMLPKMYLGDFKGAVS